MAGDAADMCFTDPPYNVRISQVVGRGQVKHREFAEASGEKTAAEFIAFLKETLGNAKRISRAGAVHYVCMDWRHIGELLDAASEIYVEHLNTAIWVKSNAGQGSFYRSQHEQVLIFRVGGAVHSNNVQLGKFGRNRSNVWTYPGMNSFRKGRLEELGLHPTMKPTKLVADAIKDATARGDIVVDPFSGSGTTILAAEIVGRKAYALELSARYVDVAVHRWQAFTKRDAVNESTGATFDETRESRDPKAIDKARR
jgi:DNA modification methylase